MGEFGAVDMGVKFLNPDPNRPLSSLPSLSRSSLLEFNVIIGDSGRRSCVDDGNGGGMSDGCGPEVDLNGEGR